MLKDLQIFYFQVFTYCRLLIKSRYRGTFSGFVWVCLYPILLFTVQSLVFKHLFQVSTPSYPLYLLGGLLPWIFISQSVDMTSNIFITNAEIIKSFPVPPNVFLLAQIIDNFINFIIPFILLISYLYYFYSISWTGLLFLPLACMTLFIFTWSLSLLVATLSIFYRDIKFITQFLTSLGFILTPIFYTIDFLPKHFQTIMSFNPVFILIKPVRSTIYHFSINIFISELLLALLVSISVGLIAKFYWNYKKNECYFYL